MAKLDISKNLKINFISNNKSSLELIIKAKR